MGITCKPYGKYESLFKKLDNKIKKDVEALKHKNETKSKKSKSEEN